MNKLNFYECIQMSLFFHKVSPNALIRVQGEDALAYLQSQITIDLYSQPEGHVRYGLRLNKKGRVCAGFYLIKKSKEDFFLLSRGTPSEEFISIIAENLVADEVEINDATSNHQLLTIHGQGFETFFSELGLAIPENGQTTGANQLIAFLDKRLAPRTYSIIMGKDSVLTPKLLDAEHIQLSCIEMEKKRMQALLARIPEEIGPDEFPQEGNLDKECVDFQKGCYLGQEVMARIHAMGKVRRKIVLVKFFEKPMTGSPLPLVSGKKEVGVLKSFTEDLEHFFGIALLHENALTDLLENKIYLEGSDTIVQKYEDIEKNF